MADPRLKQIRIKTGVVTRLTKEKGSYVKEVVREQERYEKKKADGADEYELRKQNEVINESQQIIPDTIKRLKVGYEDLKNVLEAEADLAETEEYQKAQKSLAEAESVLAEK